MNPVNLFCRKTVGLRNVPTNSGLGHNSLLAFKIGHEALPDKRQKAPKSAIFMAPWPANHRRVGTARRLRDMPATGRSSFFYDTGFPGSALLQ